MRTKREFLSIMLLLLGVGMLLTVAGTIDVKSIAPEDSALASDSILFVLAIIGCISAAAGVYILDKDKGGNIGGKQRTKKW